MVSVIIPAYNREATIARAIMTVLNQTYADLEVIVVDDCSTDNTKDVVKKIQSEDNRVIYIRHDINSGACVARNTGIKASKGEYVAFQDSDDAWRKNKLCSQLAIMDKYNADVCFCKSERHDYPKQVEQFYPNIAEGIVGYSELISKPQISTQMIVAKRKVVEDFMFKPEVKRMQDYDWAVRAGREYSFCFDSEVLVDIYLQDNSITSYNPQKIIEGYQYFIDTYPDVCELSRDFELNALRVIGKNKTLIGNSAEKEYYRIYKITRKPIDYLKWVLSKTVFLKIAFYLTK